MWAALDDIQLTRILHRETTDQRPPIHPYADEPKG